MAINNEEGIPMPVTIPTGYYLMVAKWTLSGSLRTAVSTIGLNYTGADFGADAVAQADAFSTHMNQPVNDSWKLEEISYHDAVGQVLAVGPYGQGGASHPPATPNVAFLLRKRTGAGGRANRGRMYMPGVSEQDVDGVGKVVPSKLTEWANALQAWGIERNTLHFRPYVLHSPNKLGITPPPTLITIIGCDDVVATQRRRLRK